MEKKNCKSFINFIHLTHFQVQVVLRKQVKIMLRIAHGILFLFGSFNCNFCCLISETMFVLVSAMENKLDASSVFMEQPNMHLDSG